MGFSQPQGTWLRRHLSPRVSLTITASSIEFRSDDRVIALRPVLYVRDDGIIVAVGDPPASQADELPVFVADAGVRAARLAKVVQYGLHEVLGTGLSMKPTVHLDLRTEAVSFAEVEQALERAGAGEVLAISEADR